MKPVFLGGRAVEKPAPYFPICIGYMGVQVQYGGRISGTLSRDGAPVARAAVRVFSRSSGAFITSVVTDGDGRYRTLALMALDRYTVCAIDPIDASNAVVADNVTPEKMP